MKRVQGVALAFLILISCAARADEGAPLDALIRAYPDRLAGRDGTVLVWRDGTRMPAGDDRPDKSEDEELRDGSLLDQLRPDPIDPGRVRNRAFFDKLYGDCIAARWLWST